MAYWAYYLITINIIAFVVYGIDKKRAVKGRWRVPEKTLFTLAILGGSLGAYLGMKKWRHKTMKHKFRWGIPLIGFAQAAIALLLLGSSCSTKEGTKQISNQNPSQKEEMPMVGAYSPYRDLEQEEQALFERVYSGAKKLVPEKVSTQVVAGTNYKFLCKDAAGTPFYVTIYEPLPNQGEPEVTEIESNETLIAIVFYDPAIGTAEIEKFIKEHDCEELYHYKNLHGYAIKLNDPKLWKLLEETPGVLSIQKDEKNVLHQTAE